MFAQAVRERYPEGLTGIFSIGGTRTAYILEKTRSSVNPGQIRDFADYADYGLSQNFRLIQMFFDLGGQNMIITAMSNRIMHQRGEEYAALIAKELLRFIDE